MGPFRTVVLVAAAALGCGGGSSLDNEPIADAAAESSSDAAPDAVSESAQGCGNAALQAAYPSCLQSSGDEGSCIAGGGAWVEVLGGQHRCSCPTGQGGCVCTSNSTCLSHCLAPYDSAVGSCTGVTQGHCAEQSVIVGEYCAYTDGKGFVRFSFDG
ncbi:MAG: hypothetical protein HY898_17010 [Deltaproteobacteria bacterium]|nr:hypothetical protein [Deltaproteobacteria bacterium]